MSNENPQESKDVLDIQAQLRKELEASKERVSPATGFNISTKGKQFGMPDGSVHPGPMSAVILDWCSVNLHYTGAYNPSNPESPDCFAVGKDLPTLKPSAQLTNPQNEQCTGCPKNEWGTAPGGGKGKACKNTRRLLVAAGELGDGAQVYTLNVSPTGLKHFDQYIATLTDRGLHPAQVITEISFDPNSAFPSLRFRAEKPHDQLDDAWHLKEDNQSMLLSEPNVEKAA